MNENQNDFKYLTIALNDHGGYEKTSPRIFNNIPTFKSNCNYNKENIKTFLTSDDLFFVYSVPHDCKHMERNEGHVFTKIQIPNLKAQELASRMNVDACKRTLKDIDIKGIINQQLNIVIKKFTSFLNQYFSLFKIENKENNDIMRDMNQSANEYEINEIHKILKPKIATLKKNIENFLNLTKKNQILPSIIEDLIMGNLKTILEEILDILKNKIKVDLINSPDNKEAFRKFMNMLKNIIMGTIPYYEYIVSGKHSFYAREEFNDESNDYFLNPRINLITTNIGTTNIGNNQTFIEVLKYVIQEKEPNKENQQPNSDCSIEILRYFINKIEQGMQYLTSELLIVLYIIYEHYEGNCFITVNANHCRTCINGGKPRRKTRRKIRRNKKAKTKKRKTNKKTKKRKMKTKVNRKKTKRRRTKK
jgi:hypothetical protein